MVLVSIFILIFTRSLDKINLNVDDNFFSNLRLTSDILSSEREEILHDIIKTSDNHLLMVGTVRVSSTNYNGVIVKTDLNGNVVWEKEVVGIEHLEFNTVLESSSSGYIIVGHSYTECQDYYTGGDVTEGGGIVAKFDESGNMEWHFLVGTGSSSVTGTYLSSIVEVDDGQYIAVGSDYSNQSNDEYSSGLLVKFNDNGEIKLTNKYKNNNLFYAYQEIIKTSDGNIVVAGHAFTTEERRFYGESDALLIKYDVDGNIIWEQVFDDFQFDSFNSLIELSDNSLIAVGFAERSEKDPYFINNVPEGLIVKLDEDGNQIWEKHESGYYRFESVIDVRDGNIICVGQYNRPVIVKYNEDGNKLWYTFNKINDSLIIDGGISKIKNIDDEYYALGSLDYSHRDDVRYGISNPKPIIKFSEESQWYYGFYNNYPVVTKIIGYTLSACIFICVFFINKKRD